MSGEKPETRLGTQTLERNADIGSIHAFQVFGIHFLPCLSRRCSFQCTRVWVLETSCRLTTFCRIHVYSSSLSVRDMDSTSQGNWNFGGMPPCRRHLPRVTSSNSPSQISAILLFFLSTCGVLYHGNVCCFAYSTKNEHSLAKEDYLR